jgi:hypothetical protein
VPTVRRVFRPFGAVLAVDADDADLLRCFDAAVSRFPAASARGRYRLTIERCDDAVADPAWPHTAVRQWVGGMELTCGSAVLTVDHGGHSAHARLPRSLAAIDDALRCFVEGAVSSLLIGGGELLAVHSALVQRRGVGLLLRGQSGAGKSTLTYGCVRAGWKVVSDDWVYATPGDAPGELIGYPWRVFLTSDTARFFPELHAVAAVPHPGADRWKLPIEPPVALRRRQAMVDAVVFVEPSARAAWRWIEPHEARRRFAASALPSERRDLPEAWVDGLLGRPCAVLQRGSHPADAVARLSDLITSIESARTR